MLFSEDWIGHNILGYASVRIHSAMETAIGMMILSSDRSLFGKGSDSDMDPTTPAATPSTGPHIREIIIIGDTVNAILPANVFLLFPLKLLISA